MVINTNEISTGDSVGGFLDEVAVEQPMKSTNLPNTHVALWYNNGGSNLTQVVGVTKLGEHYLMAAVDRTSDDEVVRSTEDEETVVQFFDEVVEEEADIERKGAFSDELMRIARK